MYRPTWGQGREGDNQCETDRSQTDRALTHFPRDNFPFQIAGGERKARGPTRYSTELL